MSEKNNFEVPVVDVVHIELEDIIRTSGGGIELPDHEW